MEGLQHPRILVLMPTINRPERLKLEGIFDYAHTRRGPSWSVELALDGLEIPLSKRQFADYDGIIAYVTDARQRRRLVAMARPLVLIEDLLAPMRFPAARHVFTMFCDHQAEGGTAADYFLSRHFAHFAFVGAKSTGDWCEQRRLGFVTRLAKARLACATYCAPQTRTGDDRAQLAAWLGELPRPLAVFAAHDFRARQVLAAARLANLSVPDDVAILGVDDDEMFCTTTSPAISSIPTHDFQLGYDAGRLLNELLRGEPGGRCVAVRHRHVVSRPSTDADALDDAFVARALQFVRNNLSDRLDIARLAAHVGYSKRMLQLRAQRALGHSLGLEVRRIRLSAAAEMLRESDVPVAEIADRCGFTSSSHLSTCITKAYGMRPLDLRRSHASGANDAARDHQLRR